MLQRIDYLMSQSKDFAFETTLSTRSYVQTIKRAKELGYTVYLFFLNLSSPEMAVDRVAKRVSTGGHNIPTETVYRRYDRALQNLFKLYIPICDYYLLINNSSNQPLEIAQGGLETESVTFDVGLWNKLISRYGNSRK